MAQAQMATGFPDRFFNRWAVPRTIFAIHRRANEVHGNQLASAVTLGAFVAIFPLLLSMIAIVGFVAAGSTDFAAKVVDELGLTGSAAEVVLDAIATAQRTRVAASVVGIVGLLWSGIALVGAIETTFAAVWQVKARGLQGKLIHLGWLAGMLVLLGISLGFSAILGLAPPGLGVLSIPASLAVGVAIWLWTFKLLTNRPLGWHDFLAGAVVGAIGLEVLKVLGALWLPRMVAQSSALYGSLGVVLALLAWLLLLGRLLVYAAVVNVVLWERGHGTVTVEIELPRVPGEVPVEATRSGEEVPPK